MEIKKVLLGWFDRLLKKDKKPIICQRCKEPIKEPAYVVVTGMVITNSNSPQVFTCPEQSWNYAQGIILHTVCWIKTLREHKSDLYDLKKVYAEYNKLKKGKKLNGK